MVILCLAWPHGVSIFSMLVQQLVSASPSACMCVHRVYYILTICLSLLYLHYAGLNRALPISFNVFGVG
uniref:Uncharacterized protein n=1 Tax=Rhizophora mucronata TaxID=61149 RepID=A0A2P2QXD9_RHIMU